MPNQYTFYCMQPELWAALGFLTLACIIYKRIEKQY